MLNKNPHCYERHQCQQHNNRSRDDYLHFASVPFGKGHRYEACYLKFESALKDVADKCVKENLAQQVSKQAVQLIVEEHQQANYKNKQNCDEHAATNQKHHTHVLHNVLIVPLLYAKTI